MTEIQLGQKIYFINTMPPSGESAILCTTITSLCLEGTLVFAQDANYCFSVKDDEIFFAKNTLKFMPKNVYPQAFLTFEEALQKFTELMSKEHENLEQEFLQKREALKAKIEITKRGAFNDD